jgi:hypothetical protein
MRILTPRGVALAVLAVLASVLLSGCELREGGKSEYGESLSGAGHAGTVKTVDQELLN